MYGKYGILLLRSQGLVRPRGSYWEKKPTGNIQTIKDFFFFYEGLLMTLYQVESFEDLNVCGLDTYLS